MMIVASKEAKGNASEAYESQGVSGGDPSLGLLKVLGEYVG